MIQILHDVAIQNLPVMFAIDRGGLVGADGETHQGCFRHCLFTQYSQHDNHDAVG